MSRLISAFNLGWDRMVYFMRYSIFGKICFALGAIYNWLVKTSGMVNFFSDEDVYNNVENGAIARFIGWVFSVFTVIKNKFGKKLVQNSVVVDMLSQVIENAKYISCRFLGTIMVCISPVLYMSYNVFGFGFFVVGIVLMATPISIYGVVINSFAFRIFCKIDDSEEYLVNAGISPWGLGFGVTIGALFYFIGVLPTTLAIILLISLVLVITFPEIGIFAVVFAAPFLPTMVLAAMIGGTLMLFVLKLLTTDKYTFKIDTTGIFILAFSIIIMFYGLTSNHRATSIKIALLQVLFIMSYFLIVFLIDSREKIKALVFVYCTSALFTGFVGLRQYLSGQVDMTWTDKELFETLSLRVYSTFENPNVYGEYLLLCIPMAFVMALISKRWIMKLFYGGTSLVLLVNLGLTYSRGCYLAILLCAGVIVWFGCRRLLVFSIFPLVALPFVLPQSIINRFTSILNFSDTSTSYRLGIWQGTIKMLTDFWYLGVGLGKDAYNTVYPLYSLNAIFAPHAHSLYLQVMAEMGISGFTALIAFCACFFNGAFVAFKKCGNSKTAWFLLFMMGGVIAFLFEGIFEYIWYNYRVFLLFFITMGMVSTLCRLVIKARELTFD